MEKKPLVSIDCITYNHAPFIRQCLDGFLMQKTNFDFEVLIHDDASTDGTQDIIKVYEQKYPKIIKPIYQKENQWSKGISISSTFNFPRAQGKYIALCEGDDYWTDPYKLQKQVDILESDPSISFVYTNFKTVDEKGQEIIRPTYQKYKKKSRSGNIFNLLLSGNFILTLTTCFKREILLSKEIAPSPYKLDYLYFLIAASKGKAAFIPDITGDYRMNSQSLITTQFEKINKQLYEIYKYITLLYLRKKLPPQNITQDFKIKKTIIKRAVDQYRNGNSSFLKEIISVNYSLILFIIIECILRFNNKIKFYILYFKHKNLQ